MERYFWDRIAFTDTCRIHDRLRGHVADAAIATVINADIAELIVDALNRSK